MAKGWLKNFLKGLMNNGFYMGSDGKLKPYEKFSKTGLPSDDVVGDDAASFPGLDSVIDNVADKYLGTGLTDAEQEANRGMMSKATRTRANDVYLIVFFIIILLFCYIFIIGNFIIAQPQKNSNTDFENFRN